VYIRNSITIGLNIEKNLPSILNILDSFKNNIKSMKVLEKDPASDERACLSFSYLRENDRVLSDNIINFINIKQKINIPIIIVLPLKDSIFTIARQYLLPDTSDGFGRPSIIVGRKNNKIKTMVLNIFHIFAHMLRVCLRVHVSRFGIFEQK